MLGNTILLKHAPSCPKSSAAIEAVLREAGPRDDAYINIYATNEQIAWMLADPRVQGVSLTGSERAGAAVAAEAGRNLKKVVLELGGSMIVLDSADLGVGLPSNRGGLPYAAVGWWRAVSALIGDIMFALVWRRVEL